MENISAADVRQAHLQNLLWLLFMIVQELMRRLYIHEDRLHPWTPGPQTRDTPSLAAPADRDRTEACNDSQPNAVASPEPAIAEGELGSPSIAAEASIDFAIAAQPASLFDAANSPADFGGSCFSWLCHGHSP